MHRLVFILVLFNLRVFAQMPGDLDVDFGNQGKVIIDVGDLDNCEDVAMDVYDNIYFAGYTTTFGSPTNTDFILGKLTPYGIIDSTFGVNGFYRGDFPKANASEIHQIELLNDGILIFGSGVKYGVADTQYLYVSKILYDGTLDTSFADSGVFSGAFMTAYNYPGSIAVQPNGKIIVCGAAYDSLTVQDVPLLGRLLPNGQPDTSFSSSGFKYWNMSSNLIDAGNGFGDIPEHGSGGFLNDILILENGNYLFSGFYYSGTSMHCLAMMIDSNANFISNFGTGGYLLFQNNPNCLNQIVRSVRFQDKIMLGVKVEGNFITYDFIVQAIDTLGNLITSFGSDFSGQKDVIKDMFVENDQLLLSGFSTLQQNVQAGYESDFFALAEYDSLGVLNNQFANGGLFSDNFNTNSETGSECMDAKNNKIVVGGYLNNVLGNNITDFAFMLIHNNGITNVIDIDMVGDLEIYPNPCSATLNIRTDQEVKNLSLYNINGKRMGVDVLYKFNRLTMDVSNCSKGIYMLEAVTQKGQRITEKIIVQ